MVQKAFDRAGSLKFHFCPFLSGEMQIRVYSRYLGETAVLPTHPLGHSRCLCETAVLPMQREYPFTQNWVGKRGKKPSETIPFLRGDDPLFLRHFPDLES